MPASAFETIDPSSGAVIERFERMTPAAIDARLDAAHAAFGSWRTAKVAERAALIRAVGRELRARRDRLATIAVREMGKPIVQARAEIEKCAWCCEFFADNAERMLEPQHVPGRRSEQPYSVPAARHAARDDAL